ncbi:MAG TPA: septation ring formation regulator EzrA [Oscillatoriaceae cyanobacterium]
MAFIDAPIIVSLAHWATHGGHAAGVALGPAILALPAGLGWWGWRSRTVLRTHRDRLANRHASLAAGVAQLLEARGLLRMFSASGMDYQTLEARSAALGTLADHIAHALHVLDVEMGRGRPWRAKRLLVTMEEDLQHLEAEILALSQSLRALRDEDRESERCLLESQQRLGALRAACVAERVGWTIDLSNALDACEAELAEAETLRRNGDTVRAFQRCRRNAARLNELRASLEAREASVAFFHEVPSRVARLKQAVARLERSGFRDLPTMPEDALVQRAEAAIATLRAGGLEEAVAEQRALRELLAAIAEASLAREARQSHNARRIKLLRADATAIERRCDALPVTRYRADYSARLWATAQHLLDALEPGLAAVERHLTDAEEANGFAQQRFEEAERQLEAIAADLDELRDLAGRARTLWEALPQEEARLRERFLALLGQCAEAHARARQLGLMPDPMLDALVQACRQALAEHPLALDEVALELDGLELAVGRFNARQRTLDDRLSTMPGHSAAGRSHRATRR